MQPTSYRCSMLIAPLASPASRRSQTWQFSAIPLLQNSNLALCPTRATWPGACSDPQVSSAAPEFQPPLLAGAHAPIYLPPPMSPDRLQPWTLSPAGCGLPLFLSASWQRWILCSDLSLSVTSSPECVIPPPPQLSQFLFPSNRIMCPHPGLVSPQSLLL